jgi:hypothetical protein
LTARREGGDVPFVALFIVPKNVLGIVRSG